jgi:hypothetical protein
MTRRRTRKSREHEPISWPTIIALLTGMGLSGFMIWRAMVVR